MSGKRHLHGRLPAWMLAVAILAMLCFTGCSQRELCYNHPHTTPVRIEFDWSEAPDATPGTMVVYFFPADNSQYIRFELTDDGSGLPDGFNATVNVPEGTYHVVCHNGDTENNIEKGDAFLGYHLTTYDEDLLAPLNRSDYAPRPETTEGQPVRTQADRLYAHTLPETVTLRKNAGETQVITLKPRRETVVINVTMNDVKNIIPGIEFSGIVSGLAESWYPAMAKPGGRETTVPLRLTADGPTTLRGSMEVFGDNAPHEVRHKFRLYTSSRFYYDFDVTDQIHSAPDPYNIEIVLSDVTLPKPGEGMDVSVGEWVPSESIDISM